MKKAKNRHSAAAGFVDYRDIPDDLQTFGTPNWVLLYGASSRKGDWVKSTTAMEVPGLGVLVRTGTRIGGTVSEALCFVSGATISEDPKTVYPVLVQSKLIERFTDGINELLDAGDKKKAAEKPKRRARKPTSGRIDLEKKKKKG